MRVLLLLLGPFGRAAVARLRLGLDLCERRRRHAIDVTPSTRGTPCRTSLIDKSGRDGFGADCKTSWRSRSSASSFSSPETYSTLHRAVGRPLASR